MPAGGSASGRPSTLFDVVARQAAGPQQHRLAETGDDGRFDADRRRAAIDDEIDAAAQIGEHVRRRGRRDVAGAIGRRRHDRPAEGGEDFLRHRVMGHAHRDAVEARGRELGDRTAGGLGQHQRQRPWPKRLGKFFGFRIEPSQYPRRRQIGHVGDQRIERRPALGLVEPRDGLAVGGIGAEAVNRLGRKRNQPAGLEAAHRIANGGGIGPRHAGHQWGCHGGGSVPK